MAVTLEQLIEDIHEWQIATFPDATAYSKAKHLEKEVVELLDDPTDRSEIADALMLAIGMAKINGYDVFDILAEKLAINKRRQWGKPDADGVVEHVREGGQQG